MTNLVVSLYFTCSPSTRVVSNVVTVTKVLTLLVVARVQTKKFIAEVRSHIINCMFINLTQTFMFYVIQFVIAKNSDLKDMAMVKVVEHYKVMLMALGKYFTAPTVVNSTYIHSVQNKYVLNNIVRKAFFVVFVQKYVL